MKCPQCGKNMATTRKIFEYVRKNPGVEKRVVGTEAAFHRYAPFCTLRCGWRWAKDHIGKIK